MTATKPRTAARRRTPPRGRRLPARYRRLAIALIAVSFAVVAFKLSGLPLSDRVGENLSFEGLSHAMRSRMLHLLLTPLGALIVVFTRLTLGLRVLGPFRSVLLAIAFQVTGPAVGVAFFALVVAAVTLLRPSVKAMRLPYFGRSSVMLAAVAGTVILATLAGLALGVPEVERVAYFPVVVLTLSGEAFAKTLKREGPRSALWRAGSTAATALVITGIAAVPAVQTALVRFPELELAVLGGIVLVSEYLPLRLLQNLNPPPRKKPRAGKPENPRAPRLDAPGPDAQASRPPPGAPPDDHGLLVRATDAARPGVHG